MSKLKRYVGTCAVVVLLGVLTLGASSAFGDALPNKPPEIKDGTPWLASVYSAVALAGICVVAFKNPRRTRPD